MITISMTEKLQTKTELLICIFYTTIDFYILNEIRGLSMRKNEESYYIHVYTLLDRTTRSIKIESWRSLKDEMNVLGIKDSDIFQIQMLKIDPNKKIT